MSFGKWKTAGLLVEVSGKMYIIPTEGTGRLLYEEFDAVSNISSDKSRFYEVKTLDIIQDASEDGILGSVSINLSDEDSAKELLDSQS